MRSGENNDAPVLGNGLAPDSSISTGDAEAERTPRLGSTSPVRAGFGRRRRLRRRGRRQLGRRWRGRRRRGSVGPRRGRRKPASDPAAAFT
jgi:hypothetical protein